jgi:hypothetical protein
LFAVEAREWRTHPDTTSAALRSGDLPGIAIALAGDTIGPTSLLRLVRLANLICERASRRKRSRMAVTLGFYFAAKDSELIH